MEDTSVKHLKSKIQSRSSKQTSITNDAQFPTFNFGEGFCHELLINLFKNKMNQSNLKIIQFKFRHLLGLILQIMQNNLKNSLMSINSNWL